MQAPGIYPFGDRLRDSVVQATDPAALDGEHVSRVIDRTHPRTGKRPNGDKGDVMKSDGPAGKRKPGAPVPGPDEEAEQLEIRLAEYSAPIGEELPWREPIGDFAALDGRESALRPEPGRLH